jgi:hypothetical protein
MYHVEKYDLQLIIIALFGHLIPTQAALTGNIFRLLERIVHFAKSDKSFSIDEAIVHLTEVDHILRIDMTSSEQKDAARHVIFAGLGWTSGLYSPLAPDVLTMQLLRLQDDAASSTQPLARCERPFSELLELLVGPFFPGKGSDAASETEQAHATLTGHEDRLTFDSFVVEHMNASTLHVLGELTIEWVNDMASHLVFDSLEKSVKLYRTPSICQLQMGQDSLATK